MRRFPIAFLSLLPLLGALSCTPGESECETDADCPTGEECRSLQERDENVCVRVVTPTDAGPQEEGDPVAIASFTATPNPVATGGTVTLTWSASNATSCLISGGVGGVEESGTTTATPTDSTRYTLSCQGADGPATESVDVDVIVKVTSLTLDVEAVNIAADVEASWETVGADSCVLTAGSFTHTLMPSELTSGMASFQAEESGDVLLTCQGTQGPATGTLALAVARVVTFTASPATVSAGGTSTLAWTTENVTGCAVDGVTDANPSDAQVDVTATTTTAYTLRCVGYDAADILSTVEVSVGIADAGPTDAGAADAGPTDAGLDAGSTDAGPADAGFDAG